MADEYEYKPPHGGPPKKLKLTAPSVQWEVEVPYGSELIRRTVLADTERKAFNQVAAEIARLTNTQLSVVFSRIGSKYTVKRKAIQSSFLLRALSAIDPVDDSLDLARIQRLPHVRTAFLRKKEGDVSTIRAELEDGSSFVDAKEVTGYIQSLFGARLRSSGQFEEEGVYVVEVRVADVEIAT